MFNEIKAKFGLFSDFGLSGNRGSLFSLLKNHYEELDSDIRFLGIALCWLQVFDGVLTGIGVHKLGTAFEGNPILYHLMTNFGYVQALLITKCLAIGLISTVCLFSTSCSWIKNGLIAVNFVYLYVAVIPWVITLLW